MARWMILYSDDDGDPKCAVVNDTTNGNLPFGSAADEVLDNLPNRNSGATTFIVALGDDDGSEPDVYANDQEVGREFIDL